MKKKISVVATNACGWPNLTKLKNGQVLCTYFNAPSHGLTEGDLVCSISDRNGLNWRKRGIVAKHPEGGNRIHLAVGMASNGDLLCFSSGFFVRDKKIIGFSGHWLSRSADRGRTWKTDQKPKIPKFIQSTIPFGRVISIDDRKLVYSAYRSKGRGNPSHSWMILSDDDGLSWKNVSKLGSNDSNEVMLCHLSEKRIIALVRTHLDHHVKLCEFNLSTSRWKEKGPLTLPMQHPADLCKLSDNCLLMTYGIRNKGLMGIGARLSIDAGKTWRSPWVIHQFGCEAKDIGYPSTVALDKKGTLLTAFYTDYEPTLRKNPNLYRVLTMKWSLRDWVDPNSLSLMSDDKQLFF